MPDSEPEVSGFVAAAREFCEWVEGPPADDDTERFTALVLLSVLYARALVLPEVGAESLEVEVLPDSDADIDREQRAMERLGAFPTPTYWRLDGHGDGGGEKVEDDLGRDLFLTYAAVRPILDEFDVGPDKRGLAIWAWRYSFWADWGVHSTNAIQILHRYFHDKAWSDE